MVTRSWNHLVQHNRPVNTAQEITVPCSFRCGDTSAFLHGIKSKFSWSHVVQDINSRATGKHCLVIILQLGFHRSTLSRLILNHFAYGT